VPDVVEEEIDAGVAADRSLITETVLVDFEFAGDAFVVGVRAGVDVRETLWAAVWVSTLWRVWGYFLFRGDFLVRRRLPFLFFLLPF
jgi:hypothetical protein